MKLTIWLSCYKLVTLLPGVSGRLFSNIFHCGFLWLVCFVKGDSIFLEWESVTSLETKKCITILNKQTNKNKSPKWRGVPVAQKTLGDLPPPLHPPLICLPCSTHRSLGSARAPFFNHKTALRHVPSGFLCPEWFFSWYCTWLVLTLPSGLCWSVT